ncbi:MAG: DNA/RNA helicase domain-containing protein [Pseudomonadota bacterium]
MNLYSLTRVKMGGLHILSGYDGAGNDTAVIVELKQWSEARQTERDAIVETFLGGRKREVLHPSYQAWTYAALIQDFNEAAHDGQIRLRPCAYPHNMADAQPIKSRQYADHIGKAPVFVRDDTQELQDFLSRHIRKGDRKSILYKIENGRLRPSKSLSERLASMLQGNEEFRLIDEQKLVFEQALALAKKAQTKGKQVLVVEGGPGTGKSVVCINLLVALTEQGMVTQYVTRNAAPRAVYESKLTGTLKKTHIGNLFKSSGSFVSAPQTKLTC